jgi:hypothetical protein
MKKPELICLLCLLQYTSAEIYAIRFVSWCKFAQIELINSV